MSSEQGSSTLRLSIVSATATTIEEQDTETGLIRQEGAGEQSDSSSRLSDDHMPFQEHLQPSPPAAPTVNSNAEDTVGSTRVNPQARQDRLNRKMRILGQGASSDLPNESASYQQFEAPLRDSSVPSRSQQALTADACSHGVATTLPAVSTKTASCSSRAAYRCEQKRRFRAEHNPTLGTTHSLASDPPPSRGTSARDSSSEVLLDIDHISDGMIADDLVGTIVTNVPREGNNPRTGANNNMPISSFARNSEGSLSNSVESAPGAFFMPGRAFGAQHVGRGSRVVGRRTSLISRVFRRASSYGTPIGGSSSDVVAVAESVDAEAVVYASGVVKERPRWVYCAVGAAAIAIVLALILGLTLGVKYSDEQYQGGHHTPFDRSDPLCRKQLAELDIFDICHCYGNASALVLSANETIGYEMISLILVSEKLINTTFERDSCALENQAMLSFANYMRLGMTDGSILQLAVFNASTSSQLFGGEVQAAYVETMKQHFILKLLFLTTQGPSWRNSDGWRSNLFMCTWKGITCNIFERVEVIRLPTNGLNGTIPSQIGAMPFLRTLDISSNPNLYGSIPAAISNAAKLHNVELQDCSLSGVLPPEVSNLKVLDRLNIANNSFVGTIPKEYGRLRRMRELNIGCNHLVGQLPGVIGNLTNLEILNVRGNLLTGRIPESLSQLEFLEQLDLSRNLFSGSLPDDIGHLTLLDTIVLSDTRLTGGIPESYCASDRSNSLAIVSCKGDYTIDMECKCCSSIAVCADAIPTALDGFTQP